MKATGIVRRIDELGRVVVPKEIRKTLRIREGDPLEIFTDRDGEIILKKYSPIGELGQFADQYAESLARTTGYLVCITDTDRIVASAGNGKKAYNGKQISPQLQESIENKRQILAEKEDKDYIRITTDDSGDYASQAMETIVSEGDAIGSVVLYNRDENRKMGNTEQVLIRSAADFLGRQMTN